MLAETQHQGSKFSDTGFIKRGKTIMTENQSASTTSSTWFNSASDALRAGMSDAQKSAEKMWPKIGAAVSKGVFSLGYGLGYGVAFPAVLIAKIVPQENCAVWGLIDGANVAKDSAWRDRTSS